MFQDVSIARCKPNVRWQGPFFIVSSTGEEMTCVDPCRLHHELQPQSSQVYWRENTAANWCAPCRVLWDGGGRLRGRGEGRLMESPDLRYGLFLLSAKA